MAFNTLTQWYQRSIASTSRVTLASIAMLPAAALYALGYGAAQRFVPQGTAVKRLPKPVISVGNITCGGTGKTPFVLFLRGFLAQKGKNAVVLTRGYGSDETRLLTGTFGEKRVVVGSNRFAAAARYLRTAHDGDVFIMDDGFQHRALHRDLDIVLVNARCPFGNGFLVPAGTLREPLAALKRAQLVVLTHADGLTDAERAAIEAKMKAVCGSVPAMVECAHRPTLIYESTTQGYMSIEQLKGREVIVFCGIGYGEGFRRTIAQLGAKIVRFVEFADHQMYMGKTIEPLMKLRFDHPNAVFVTTEKDYVRNESLLRAQLNAWVVKVGITITKGEDIVHAVIDRILSR